MMNAVDEKTSQATPTQTIRGSLKVNDSSPSLVAVTPSDSVDIAGGPARHIWVGGAGNIAILAENDTAPVTLVAVPAGTRLPIRAKRVYSTGTTATNITALL